jgi:acyl-CoA thioester hydrolase
MFSSDTLVRVRYAETDAMHVVYHGCYAQYFEVGRAEAIRRLGYTYRQMEEQGLIMPVVELTIRFLRPALYDDLLTVRTILKEIPDGHSIRFHHEVWNENNKLLTEGSVTLFFLDAATRAKLNMPFSLKEKLLPYFQS